MSYDLTVFKKETTPRTREQFDEWFNEKTKWGEGHSYQDPEVTSIELRNWFLEMIKFFPALNGPFSDHDEDNEKVTDYCIGKDMIYVSFDWSFAEEAYIKMRELAEKHGVGFYDTSADNGDILFPSDDGKLNCIDKPDNISSIEQIKKMAKDGQSGKSVMDILFSQLNISGLKLD